MKEPIRILNLFTIMNRGGAETMVMNYYRKIDRSKIQFDFLVHREEKGVYEEEIERLGGRIYRMSPLYPQNFGVYKKRIREFLKNHPEYRIIHSHMSELGYFVFKEAKRQHIPTIICHAHSAPKSKNLKMAVRFYFKHKMLPYITHMFTCGDEAGIWLYGRKNKKKFIQLNNAIDTEKYIYDKKTENIVREELGLGEAFVVGHVGRFCAAKNHKQLIDIFEQIVKMRNNSKLVLVGEGTLQEEIEQRVKEKKLEDKVLFLGERSDVNRILQALDVFVFPSFYEGLSVAIIEAQTAGVQCFISDSIPDQCIITDSVKTFSLNENNQKIAKFIIENNSNFTKKVMYKEIAEAGFDINENALKLQNFYLGVYQEI